MPKTVKNAADPKKVSTSPALARLIKAHRTNSELFSAAILEPASGIFIIICFKALDVKSNL